jgi:hypothetical protein
LLYCRSAARNCESQCGVAPRHSPEASSHAAGVFADYCIELSEQAAAVLPYYGKGKSVTSRPSTLEEPSSWAAKKASVLRLRVAVQFDPNGLEAAGSRGLIGLGHEKASLRIEWLKRKRRGKRICWISTLTLMG